MNCSRVCSAILNALFPCYYFDAPIRRKWHQPLQVVCHRHEYSVGTPVKHWHPKPLRATNNNISSKYQGGLSTVQASRSVATTNFVFALFSAADSSSIRPTAPLVFGYCTMAPHNVSRSSAPRDALHCQGDLDFACSTRLRAGDQLRVTVFRMKKRGRLP